MARQARNATVIVVGLGRFGSALAEELYGEERARLRVRALAAREAEILARQPIRPRVH